MKLILRVLSLLALLSVSLAGCSDANVPADQPSENAVSIQVAANTGLTSWLTGSVKEFNTTRAKLADGRPVFVNLQSVEAGQAVIDMTGANADLPDLWIPDSPVWVDILAARGKNDFQGDCASVAQSPLVIAMWRPIAESLGWPGRALGWLDIGSLAADPSAWAYYSGGQFGKTFRLGHTHPGLSSTGTATLLAVVQAALSKKQAVSTAEIQQPIVQASMGAFEGAVASFGNSTDSLGQAMRQRGINYLGAAVMYESTVIQYGAGDPQIVPIYPFEGTFMATHPACIDKTKSDEQQQAARLFRTYLTSLPAQQAAVVSGLRAVNPQVTFPTEYKVLGVDLSQPKIVFDPPSADTVFAAQKLWQSARKHVNLVMVVDTSGSMDGPKLESVRAAAVQFVNQMGDEDYLSMITFNNGVAVVQLEHAQVGSQRLGIIASVNKLRALGSTPLYDSIGQAGALIARHLSAGTTNAMVVLTDGLDTNSQDFQANAHLAEVASANDTTIFTIAYGTDADELMLKNLATNANGNFYLGSEANIASIYQDMSAAFGGSAGIGR